MSRNPVRSAVEGVDAEPSDEFLRTLRAQLLTEIARAAIDDTAPSHHPNGPVGDYVALARRPWRRDPMRRRSWSVLAVAASVVLLVGGALVVRHTVDTADEIPQLHDVDVGEAVALAPRALVGPEFFDHFESPYEWAENELPKEAAATIAELPDCAVLTSVGLLPPTTKAVAAYRYGGEFMQQVFVFATAADASHAMDVIAGKVFPRCWVNLYDRALAFRSQATGVTSHSEAWDAPAVSPHGDRQVIIGQHSTINHVTGPVDAYFINGFVQVGRGISVINSKVLGGDVFMTEKAIAAETEELKTVSGL